MREEALCWLQMFVPKRFQINGILLSSHHAAFQVPRTEYSLLLMEEKTSWGPLGHGGQGEH